MTTRYTGVILTGGQNTRMQGRIKAFVEFGGITFLDRIFKVLSGLFSEIILVTKDPELYESWRDRTRVVRDILATQSPLSGIHSGLVHADGDYGFCIGCDTPMVQKGVVEILMDAIDPQTDIVVPVSGPYFQPLCAVYSKKCISLIEEQITKGDLKVDRLFNRVALKKISYEKFLQADPGLISFFNINCPDDIEEAKRLIADNLSIEHGR